MTADLLPLRALLLAFAGFVHRERLRMIEYLSEEDRVLRELHGDRRLRFSDDQWRRLAAKGERLGRRLLHQVCTIVTPDTIMRWQRRLIADEWTYEQKCRGQRQVMQEIRLLIVRMARENSTWG